MRQIKYLIILLISFFSVVLADEKIEIKDLSTEAKIDSIFKMQQQVLKEQNTNPLENKKYGFEFNIFRFLAFKELRSFSGSISLFDVNRHGEITFPFYFGKESGDYSMSELNLDIHYRYFLGNNQKGFYLSTFARYCYLDYYTDGDYCYDENGYSYYAPVNKQSNRIGFGVGLGYRIFSKNGLYWGVGLAFGRYLGNEIDAYHSIMTYMGGSTSPLIIDLELLKFGYAF